MVFFCTVSGAVDPIVSSVCAIRVAVPTIPLEYGLLRALIL